MFFRFVLVIVVVLVLDIERHLKNNHLHCSNMFNYFWNTIPGNDE